MTVSMGEAARRGRQTLHRLSLDPALHRAVRFAAWFAAGFFLSAASLAQQLQPFALALLCALSGLPAVMSALGGALGYWVFWGQGGMQGLLWLAAGLACALLVGDRRIARDTPLLMPSIAGLIVAAGGVVFQFFFADETTIPTYLLRVALAASCTRLMCVYLAERDTVAGWLVSTIAVLALAQVAPFAYFDMGYLAAGVFAVTGAFPAAALSGLALDLASVTTVPMAAVLSLAYLTRLIPRARRWTPCVGCGAAFLLVCGVCGRWDLTPLPCLLIGSAAGVLLPVRPGVQPRRGETGVAQVRLEMAAETMAQCERLLLEAHTPPVDGEALVQRAAMRACEGCPCRRECRDREKMQSLPGTLLQEQLLSETAITHPCRKSARIIAELRRAQEQYRALCADRARRKEYRAAAVQQYQFLAGYLRELADVLPRRARELRARYAAQVAICGNRPEADNGDRCRAFTGPGCRYYVLLCDGMGTGLGATDEGNTAALLLQRLLEAGFPAQYALRSLNSLCALRDLPGAATVDLAELELDSGRGTLYKWGAAPSYFITRAGTEKIGTAGAPPGLSVTDGRETSDRLSLRRGETLVLVSDGAGGEDALLRCEVAPDAPLGETARAFLERGEGGTDDATALAVRLALLNPAT